MSSPPTLPLTYNGFVTQLANFAVVGVATVGGIVQGTDTGFQTVLAQALQYAELRIQRDCDLNQAGTSNAYSLVASNNQLAISVNDFVAVQTITLSGSSIPLLAVTKEFIQNVYGSNVYLAQPMYFAPFGGDQATGGNTSTNFLIGPTPDQAYPISVFGTQRLASLGQNASNSTLASTATTWISTNLPDLLLVAAMIFVSMYQRNFGAASNDPEMPGSFENQYQTLLKGAVVEEARKKFWASAWSAYSPATIATPSRGQG